MKSSIQNLNTRSLYRFLPLMAALLIFNACSDDTPEIEEMNTTSNLVQLDFVLDFGNEGNASDMIIQYSVKDASTLSDLWLFIAPGDEFSELNSTTLSELTSNQYQSINASTAKTQVSPLASLLDAGGNQIEADKKYRIGFATIKNGIISKEISSREIELKDQHYITGRYNGSWKDDSFPDLQLSIDISSSGNFLEGPTFYNQNFVPQYGGEDDGRISFKVDGLQIKDVIINEFQDEFMGGCAGIWTGSGIINDILSISLKLEGENCFYSSSNVEVELTRFF